MFIWSVKLNRNLVWGLCAAICLSIGGVAAFSPKNSVGVLNNNVDPAVKDVADQVAFLQSFGYAAEKDPVLIEEVIIPTEFDEQYSGYNELQKISGFDLSKYKGRRAKKYTYKITDYPNYNGDVVANLLIYKGKVIGGDISSAELNGFTHGFIKE